jgi:subtilisin family serine protease
MATGLVAMLATGVAGAQVFDGLERARLRARGVETRVLDALESRERTRVIVLLEEPADDERVLARLRAAEGRVLRRLPGLRSLALEVGPAALARIAETPGVRRVGPDVLLELQASETMPLVGLDALQAEGFDGSGTTVAIIDTGIDTDHPAYADALVAEQCYCASKCCPNGKTSQGGPGAAEGLGNGHGTRLAGILASTAAGAVGGAPGSSLVAVKVFPDSGSAYLSDALMALAWIRDERPEVDVVNLSFGAGLYEGHCDGADTTTDAFADALAPLHQRGTLSVAGAGNNRSGSQMITPACLQDVVSVGAVWDDDVGSRSHFGCTDPTTAADQVTCWSNASTTTDVFAPGGLIWTASPGGVYGTAVGTSYATPVVSSCAAVLMEALPGASIQAIASALTVSPVFVVDATNGLAYPRLDCRAALYSIAPRVPALPGDLAGVALLAGLLVVAGLRVRRRRQPSRPGPDLSS